MEIQRGEGGSKYIYIPLSGAIDRGSFKKIKWCVFLNLGEQNNASRIIPGHLELYNLEDWEGVGEDGLVLGLGVYNVAISGEIVFELN